MIIRKAFKYRIKTNGKIEARLSRFGGSCRFV
ncbi:helix-turn-helix domain-containing protein [Candidatus Babeliales bacterium]|nr:helix-turn-helix domain-containing protein [Candidatus Babeliales bacterium]